MTYLEVNSFELLDSKSEFGTNGFLIEGGTNVAAGTDSSKGSQTVTGYAPVPVAFDGTNDYLLRGADLTGAANSKNGLISLWFKRTGGAGDRQRIWQSNGGYIDLQFSTSNKVHVQGYNAAGSKVLDIETTDTVALGRWHHFMASWNGTAQHVYLDGLENKTSTTNIDEAIDLTHSDWAFGAAEDTNSKSTAEYADFIFDNTYLDLSSSSNRDLFILSGAPVNPGSDGSTAVVAGSPLVYMNQNALASWHTNSGTGGGFTENGALTAGTVVTKALGSNDFTKSGTITATNDSPTNGDAE